MLSTLVLAAVALTGSFSDLRVEAATAQSFAPAAPQPTAQSSNYTGPANTTLTNSNVVPGKAFDRFIQIWLENTDYAVAASSPAFQELTTQGILLSSYYAVTHPSEPNYVASVGGDFFGLGDDNFYNIPANISTIADLLEAKNVTWAEYEENEPSDGYSGFNYTSPNYANSSAPGYTYYVRKHNPLAIYESVGGVPERAALLRNFNDFADDLVNGTIPQWVFVTPNMVDDGHDTTIDYVGGWLDYWLVPLLKDERFNNNRTLILLTFDENETYDVENVVYSLLLGGAVPEKLINTTDDTFYTHYSSLSTVEANWGLGSLGRQDTNKIVSNVFSFVANLTSYTNVDVPDKPLTNITGILPGPLNSAVYVPFAAPNASAVGAGGGPVFVAPGINTSLTPAALPAPVNLTSKGAVSPYESVTAMGATPSASSTKPATSGSGGSGSSGALGAGVEVRGLVGIAIAGVIAAVAGLLV